MKKKDKRNKIVISTVAIVVFVLVGAFVFSKYSDNTEFDMESASVMPVSDVMYDGMNRGMAVAEEPMMMAKNARPVTNVPTDDVEDIVTVEKKIIKTGNLDIKVKSVDTAMKEIKGIAVKYGGDDVSSDITENDTYKEGYITIKVPVEKYGNAFEDVKGVAKLVLNESSNSQDVTAQFVDLESRIKNKKEHEETLRTFFDKAKEVSELIQIERELARVRTEIEQMEGNLKQLKDKTQYSTISVSVMENPNIVISDTWQPMQVIKDSFNTLLAKITNFLSGVIRFVIIIMPFILIFAGGIWLLYFIIRRIFGDKNIKK